MTKNKLIRILIEASPILLMIALIPIISDDYILTADYAAIITSCLFIKYEKKDYKMIIFGFTAMFIVEVIFIQTGVETFNRISLLGIMPLWLPFLWAYAFVAIKRGIKILK